MTSESQSRTNVKAWVGSALVILVALSVWSASAVAPEGSAGSGDAPAGNNPNDLPVASCFWTGPFTHSNPKTNLAYPGTEITYWGAKFKTPPNLTLTLKGRFPHARYSSLNAYKADGVSASSLADSAIRPDRGSVNPSIPGQDRRAKKRSYTVRVIGKEKPRKPARNTLYAEPIDGSYQDILYRVYIPDEVPGKKPSLTGGTGLPTPSLKLKNGKVLTGKALCNRLSSSHDYQNERMSEPEYERLLNGNPGVSRETNPATETFSFSTFWNRQNAFARYFRPEFRELIWNEFPNYEGTQYDNGDARYMTGAYAFDFGKVFVLRGTLPTTPRTLNGQRRMTSGQLVAWDMCIIQSPVTTKTWRCVFDEQLPLRTLDGKKRQYTIVISDPEDRPSNATPECGVWWMPADPEGDGAGRPNVGQLLTRNVLPAKGFTQSSWSVPSPFPVDAETTMGPYYPRGTYFESKEDFETLGCLEQPKTKEK